MPYQTIDPASGRHVETFAEHDDDAVARALAQADAAYAAWRRQPIPDRAALLERVAALMRERADQLSTLITLEMGKLLTESKGETALSADILSYYAKNGAAFLEPTEIAQEDGSATVVSDPIGIVFAIEPWNFPYYQLARVAGPNLVTGNVVVVKHAEGVPRCAEAFERLFLDAGAPPGLYTNLRLSSDQASTVIADKRVQGVALTGSNRAGAAVTAAAGKVTKRTTMELGGSDPFIVLEDADLEMAIKWAAWSRLLNCGQGCVDAKRFIVVEALFEPFLAGLRKAVEAAVIGDPADAATTLGPLSSERAMTTLLDQIGRAVAAGATLAAGGTRVDRPGFYVHPGILTDIGSDNPAAHEEFFDPVFLLFKVKDEDAAIALANDTEFGLSSAIFTNDVDRAHRLTRRIDAGMVFINHGAWTAPELPFGGVKGSGYGRELGAPGMQEFVNKKLIRTQSARSDAL